MPELPEVETVALGLRPLSGRRLGALEIIDSKVWFESELAPEALAGLVLREVSRRGKYLLLRFERGLTLVQHLRMTGKMLEAGHQGIPVSVAAAAPARSGKGLQIRCCFRFEGKEICFFDTRRFGTLTLVSDEEGFFSRKGIAPDPFHERERARIWFLARMRECGKPVKAALLDQGIVAGVGNIYADEALHGVGVHPRTLASQVPDPTALWNEVLRLLERSIRMGGTTILNYVNAEGKEGEFARLLRVYGREGEPCPGCAGPVARITLAGRSTHFCPRCQPPVGGRKRPSQGSSKRAHSGPSGRSGISANSTARERSKRRSPRKVRPPSVNQKGTRAKRRKARP